MKKNGFKRAWNSFALIKLLLMIKLVLILVFTTTLQAFALDGASQKRINLELKNQSISSILKTIELKYDYTFFYNDDLGLNTISLDLVAKNATIDNVMEHLLKNSALHYEKISKGIVVIISDKKVIAPILIEGKVVNEKGEPLPGATVLEKGTQHGTTTNETGDFSISVSDINAILVVSALGHISREVSVKDNDYRNIVLSPTANNMDEVIVVGLGNKQRKISIIGALATVSAKELQQSPVANLTNALAGRLPGLFTVQNSTSPGASSNLFIRGIATLGTASAAPLMIIDGLPRTISDFGNIDPMEVESVTILKDAASTALYGIQGANGVVVVTTRRGTVSKKPEISFTAQAGLQSPTRMPKYLDNYNLALYSNDLNDATIWTEQDLENIKNNTDPHYYPYTNWPDYLFKKEALMQSYNVNFTGGNEFAKYFVSSSYLRQASLFDHENENAYGINSNFNRYNFRSNIDLKVTKMLDLGIDVAGRLESNIIPGRGYDYISGLMFGLLPNITSVFNPDGTIAHGGKISMANDIDNPYGALVKSGYTNQYRNVLYGTFKALHKLDFITKGLSAQLLYTFQNDNQKTTSYSQNYDDYWYKGLDGDGKPIYQQIRVKTSLATSGSSDITRNNYLDVRLNYNRDFGDHTITTQVLGSRTLRVINDRLPFAYQGFASHTNYSFKNKYFAELNIGYNGSENFPPGKRYGFFPAAGAGWVLSNEKFLENNKIINFLKFRGSYGEVGNDQIGGGDNDALRFLYITDYIRSDGYYFGYNADTGPGGYSENRVGNPNVTWERAKKMNIGTDVTFLNRLFSLTVDFFRERRSNILLASGTVPSYAGIVNLAARNTGEVLNSGFEAELKFNKSFTNGFRINTMLQVTYAKNKVLNNDQPPPAYPYQSLIGYPVGYALGYKSAGIFNSQQDIDNSPKQLFSAVTKPGDIKYFDVNNDGIIDPADRVPVQISGLVGNIPRYSYGASVQVGYKGFDISVLINGTSGSVANILPPNADNILQGRSIWMERWSPTNMDHALLPRASKSLNNYQTSDFWIMNSSYLKLRNAEVGYRFNSKFLSRIHLNTARLFLNGQNLFVWDKMWFKEQDPEATSTSIIYPAQRVINMGLNLTF